MPSAKELAEQKARQSFEAMLDSEAKNRFRKVLVFGPSGVGKTTFVGSAALDPRTSPVLVLDFDGGSMSLEGLDPKTLRVKRVKDWDDFNIAYDYLASGNHPYKTVAVDSLSELHVFSMLNIVDDEIAEAIDKARKEGKKEDQAKRIDELEIQQQDYGKSMVQIRRFLRAMLNLDMHCIFTALPKSAKIAREGTVQLPAMFGQMAEEVVGMFDVTGYINQEEQVVAANPQVKGSKPTTRVVRVLNLQNTPGVRVKVRTPFGESASVPNRILIGEKDGVPRLFNALKVPMP